MKRLLPIIWLVCVLCSTGWAQKKLMPAAKALRSAPVAARRPAQRTPKQLLEATRLFIGQNGRRPRTEIYQKHKISTAQLTPQQKAEIHLGRSVYNLLRKAQQNPTLNTPVVQRLRGLLNQFPTHPNNTRDLSALVTRLRAFIKENGRKPKTFFYKDGVRIPMEELSPEQKQECRLGQALYQLLNRANQNPSLNNTDEVSQIRQLFMQYPVKVTTKQPMSVLKQLPQLVQDTQAFITQHNRRPKVVFYENGVVIPTYQLTPAQRAEVQLGQSLSRALFYAKKQGLTELADIQILRNLLEPYQSKYNTPAPSVETILEQAKTFIAQNGRRPKNAFLDDHGLPKTLSQLPPQEAQEVQLASAISRVFQRAQKGKLSGEEELVQELRNLVTAHPNGREQAPKDDTLVWQEVLTQLEQFTTLYGRRPRARITNNGISVAYEELSPEELEEVRLGQKLSQIFTKAKANGQEQHPLIVQLHKQTQQVATLSQANLQSLAEQLQQFLQTYQRSPRNNMYKDGHPLRIQEMSAEELEEVRLFRRINHVLAQAQQNGQESDPAIMQLQKLLGPRTVTQLDTQQLAQELEQFIQTYHHRPHTNFTAGPQLSPLQKEEIKLGTRCYSLVRRARKNSNLPQDPALQKIIQLWENTPIK